MNMEEAVDEETAANLVQRIAAMFEVEAPDPTVTSPHESTAPMTRVSLLSAVPPRRRLRENDEDESMHDDELERTNETPVPEPAQPVDRQEPTPPRRTRSPPRLAFRE